MDAGKSTTAIDPRDWALLALLSVLWGGSFFFAGVAVRELPPLSIVSARVGLAALLLLPLHWIMIGRLPSGPGAWRAFLVMAMLNNVIPFSLIVTAQHGIASGLASVLNATTPLFTVVVLAAFGEEKLLPRKIVGVLAGLGGIAILEWQGSFAFADARALLCLGAALSYGFAGLWGRRHLAGVAPLTSATCQLICSTLIMSLLAAMFERPWHLPIPSASTLWSLVGLAALSTALAYIVFFQILVRSGSANVMLVTLLVPVTSIFLGHFVLGEVVRVRDIIGALVIASSLLIVDGRVLTFVVRRLN
jgi:drug/metabolite transporter (DMT)-like permease